MLQARLNLFLMLTLAALLNMNAANAIMIEKTKIKDYGVRGHIFPIIEESLLEVIMTKLTVAEQNGILATMQEQFKNKVIQKISSPTPVQNLHKATKNQSWRYDPTFSQKSDIKDQNGKILVAAGTTINPLDKINWGEPLILIDGDDQEQIAWAKSNKGKLVLTKGNPIELGKKLNRPVFFDQAGILTKHFKITAMPTIIAQEGRLLKIREIQIK